MPPRRRHTHGVGKSTTVGKVRVPIGIGSNIASLQAQRRLASATDSLTKTYERLSSGQRVNRASDDAAGLAVSTSLGTNTRVYTQALRNGNDGISLYSIADATVSSLTDINIRLQELAEQSANGVYSPTQRKAMDAEAQALSKEYFRVSRVAQFNGTRLFDGSMSSGLRLQLGYGTNGSIQSSVGGKLGDGTLSVASSFTSAPADTRDAAIADLNGDNNLDLVNVSVDGSGGGILTILRGNGSAGFTATATFTDASYGWNGVALGDVNGDGFQDIVAAGSSSAVAMVLIGSGNGSFSRGATYATEASGSRAVALGDLNNDGFLDLVTAGSGGGSGRATVRLGAGNGTFGTAVSYATETGAGSYSSAVVLADVSGDGNLDIVTAGFGGSAGRMTVLTGTGSGSFGTAVSYAATSSIGYGLAIGDINNDNNLDAVTVGVSGIAGEAIVRLGTGGGSFGAAVTYTSEPFGTFGVQLADLNGDGNLDLLTSGSTGVVQAVSTRLGSNSGAFGSMSSTLLQSTGSSGQPSQLVVGDVNGDGTTDIVQSGMGYYEGVTAVLIGNTRDGISPMQPFSLRNRGDALQALGLFSRTAKNLSDIRGSLGATLSRVDTAISSLTSMRENATAAASRITDADIAQESAQLIRTQILQQAGAAILAQANQTPALALRLLA